MAIEEKFTGECTLHEGGTDSTPGGDGHEIVVHPTLYITHFPDIYAIDVQASKHSKPW